MKYRVSSYLIDTPLKASEGKLHFFIHGYTGAIDIVDAKVADALHNLRVFEKTDVGFSEKTFDLMVKRGYITDKTAVQERELTGRLAGLLHKDAKRHAKSFVFMVTYDCNFRCPYCYEAGISGNGRHWTKRTFTKELVDRAYQAMSEIAPDNEKKNSIITLYGGEPFLKENVDIVTYIVKKGQELGYVFDAITNGHDLDCYTEVLSSGAMRHVQITLDGMKDMHDSRRFHYQTHKSFDKILSNIKLALDNGIMVGVRFNADANNFGEIKKLQDIFAETGFSDSKLFSFNTAMLSKENSDTKDTDIDYFSREKFNQMYAESGLTVPHQDYGVYDKVITALKNKTCIRFRSIFCGVQSGSYILDPYGDIYTCWDTVGKPEYVLGRYAPAVEFNDRVANWQGRNIANTPKCSCCKYALLCGGGCMAKALKYGGNFNASYCDGYDDIVNFAVNKAYNNAVKDKIFMI
ncbi:radical SAM/SPASM domain-containing protein [Paraprevotella clara]|nr:SPASM domain-containing protein [Paraprevotella clara]